MTEPDSTPIDYDAVMARTDIVHNGDGTYTVVDPDGGDWLVRNTPDGWEAYHPEDGFEGVLWATAADALAAIVGPPWNAITADGRRYIEVSPPDRRTVADGVADRLGWPRGWERVAPAQPPGAFAMPFQPPR